MKMPREFPSINLTLAANSFRYFCLLIMEQKLGAIHEEWIHTTETTDKDVSIIAARGHFKTTIMSVCYPLWNIYKCVLFGKNPLVIGAISASQDQSTEIMGLIKNHITEKPVLKELLMPEHIHSTKWSETQIKTKGGHRILSLPFNDSVRGKHFDICISDDVLKAEEITNVEYAKQAYYGIVYPTTQAKRGKHIVVGTPVSYTDLLHDLALKESFVSNTYPAVLLKPDGTWDRPIFPEHFNLKMLKKIHATMPSHLWSREYMCEPLSTESSVFPPDMLKKAVAPYDEIKKLYEIQRGTRYMGCDIAVSVTPTSDWSVFSVLEKGSNLPYLLVDEYRARLATDANVKKIAEMQKFHNCTRINVEKTGVGWGVAEACTKHDLLKGVTKPFDTKKKSKEDMLGRLEVMLRNGELVIPPNDGLISELGQFAYKKGRNGIHTYESLGRHDDRVISLALALAAADSAAPVSLALI